MHEIRQDRVQWTLVVLNLRLRGYNPSGTTILEKGAGEREIYWDSIANVSCEFVWFSTCTWSNSPLVK